MQENKPELGVGIMRFQNEQGEISYEKVQEALDECMKRLLLNMEKSLKKFGSNNYDVFGNWNDYAHRVLWI